ncbi:hypothetical protein [Nafulsella turpanensis]|uniref:hypothetical protein n=1 Tax=Nafulsella turpanensis TaxID=1265690 RepID=UPI00034B477F|nr:hypothetical protein [Nafulsella turpanensis]
MKKIILALLAVALLESCAPRVISRAPAPVPGPGKGEKKGSLSLHTLGIPPGHMPPPGSCRIWYPGRPPGHQPPPFKCSGARREIPPGAFLVQRLDGRWVQVDEFDQKRPNFIVRTGTFQLDEKESEKQKGRKVKKQKHKKQG